MSSSSRSGQADLLEVGRIEKVHGLRGEVVVGLTTNMVSARTAVGTEFSAEGRRLTIVGARPHKNKWLMLFDGVAGRDEAEGLRGLVLHAPALPADAVAEGEIEGQASEVVAFIHELIGLIVVDQDGVEHGPVVSVIDNPASDLLELEDGRMVPLSFYQHHDDQRVSVDVPPGLLTEVESDADARSDAESDAG